LLLTSQLEEEQQEEVSKDVSWESSFVLSCFWTKFWTSPTVIAIMIDEIILKITKTKPNNEYVARIESTPVIGVDIKKMKLIQFYMKNLHNN
jgi:hypothetical protein